MKLSKKAIIERELKSGKNVIEIIKEFDITPAYVYKVKRNMKSLPTVTKPELINVTSLVKTQSLNELSINGLSVKCSDAVLYKIFKGL